METPPYIEPEYIGEYARNLDPKNRISVPAKWVRTGADEFYISADAKRGCLKVLPPEEFRKIKAKLEASPLPERDKAIFRRRFSAEQRNATADKQGRLVLPEEITAPLNLGTDVMLVGSTISFEIWNPEKWAAQKQADDEVYQRMRDEMGL